MTSFDVEFLTRVSVFSQVLAMCNGIQDVGIRQEMASAVALFETKRFALIKSLPDGAKERIFGEGNMQAALLASDLEVQALFKTQLAAIEAKMDELAVMESAE